jgi:hypothetical protein
LPSVWIYFTWAAIDSCSSVGRDDEEIPARPGPVTRDICIEIASVSLEVVVIARHL